MTGPEVGGEPLVAHRYLSTACEHEQHNDCGKGMRERGETGPPHCKYCPSVCVCLDCDHAGVGADLGVRHVPAAAPGAPREALFTFDALTWLLHLPEEMELVAVMDNRDQHAVVLELSMVVSYAQLEQALGSNGVARIVGVDSALLHTDLVHVLHRPAGGSS